MDANGTRFHLISGEEDWHKVQDVSPASMAWDPSLQSITLKPEIPLFPRGSRSVPLDPAERRGAACDRFGSWYWIGQDRRTLYRSPSGTVRAVLYWKQDSLPHGSVGTDFIAEAPPLSVSYLAGLAVTAHHYLVVGILDPAGLLVFDLHAGGDPLRLEFPTDQPFEPFDITAAADGGVWILDRLNRRLWGLDRYFRLLPLTASVSAPLDKPGDFLPEGEEVPTSLPESPIPQGLSLPALDPTAVEALPDGSLLVLDQPLVFGGNSRLWHYRPGNLPGTWLLQGVPFTLPDISGVVADGEEQAVEAYDLAYLAEEKRLLVVEAAGNQAIAYHVTLPETDGELRLEPLAMYLPMHYFGKRALVIGVTNSGENAVFYDVTPFPEKDLAVRWLRLQLIEQWRYERQAILETPIFDSHQRECTWHRLFLDACVPQETEIEVWSRASNDDELILLQAYQPEPGIYLRERGAEIPYWEGWKLPSGETTHQNYTGTWETLFQNSVGRYLQLRLVLTGNGRATPAIRRLRAYYPRFSYVKNYLPAAYSEEPTSAGFLERMLANLEGFYTDLEGKITQSRLLFDSRAAPADALDWLATWVGLVLDPLWSKVSQADRRRLLIRFARRLYERRGTPDGLCFALMLLLDPCLEATLERLQRAALIPDLTLRRELEHLALPYPTLATSDVELEELLYHLVLSAPGRSRVRIVEHWQTRTAQGESAQSLEAIINAAAHQFSVLIPEGLPYEQAAMVEKIVRLEKPAHTQMDIRRFWDYFLIGQARLEMDTILGEEGRFLPIILGRDYLSEGYLENAHPMDVTERAISDRDRMGDMRL